MADSTTNNQPKMMTLEEARGAITLAMDALRKPENQKRLKDILEECNKEADPMKQFAFKMGRLLPAVTEVLGSAFKDRNVMAAVMQVQAHAANDPQVAVGVSNLMKALGGDLSALDQNQDEEFEEVE